MLLKEKNIGHVPELTNWRKQAKPCAASLQVQICV